MVADSYSINTGYSLKCMLIYEQNINAVGLKGPKSAFTVTQYHKTYPIYMFNTKLRKFSSSWSTILWTLLEIYTI